ncbi:hypothetical protein DMENIID0001_049820 [Sergentomyia squamirostris]
MGMTRELLSSSTHVLTENWAIHISRVAALARTLLVVLVIFCAHDTVAETTSDLVDAPVMKTSVVSDWKTVCQHLYRINLSGSGCAPTGNLNQTSTVSLPREQLDRLCPTLCHLSLGLPSCACITPYRFLWRSSERNVVCQLFCTVTESPLDGCTPCVDPDITTEIPTTTTESTTTPATTKSTTKSTTTTTKTTKTPTTSTTPNWAELCSALCQIGEGGVLCNCDLPPFF